jgi:hypothetical protein
MLHACFTPIALCFVYTLWHFYAFSRTNLLKRCHSASSCFLLFCVSEKLHRKYSRNWTKWKPKFLFWCHVHGVERGDGEEPGGSHTRWWRGSSWPRHQVVWAPGPPSDIALPPIYSLWGENPKESSPVSIHEKFRSAAIIEDQFWGTEVSVPAPYRDGELPPEPSPSTPPPSPSMLLTPMMRRE